MIKLKFENYIFNVGTLELFPLHRTVTYLKHIFSRANLTIAREYNLYITENHNTRVYLLKVHLPIPFCSKSITVVMARVS